MVKDSEILKCARKRIADGTNSRICYAIASIYMGTYKQRDRLTDWVHAMLGPGTFFYEDWLIDNHPDVARSFGVRSSDSIEAARPGRLAWLDWMIAECEKEEAKC